MGALDGSGPCGRAETFYYDLLEGHDSGAIPSSVIDHIRGCDRCHKRIRQLVEVLSHVDGAPGGRAGIDDVTLVHELQLHFEYLGKDVACRNAKPFLPGLLMPSLKLRIPTPITGHVDRCEPCAEDLAALSELKLRGGQLQRLRRLYGTAIPTDRRMCRDAKVHIAAFASGRLAGIDPALLEHICLCPDCRGQVYHHRQKLLSDQAGGSPEAEGVLDDSLSMAEVFDDVVPYGRVASESDPGQGRGTVPEIPAQRLAMMQRLHRTVYDIAGRVDSALVTVCSVGQGSAALDDQSEGLTVTASARGADAGRSLMSRAGVRPYVKVAFLAAAMLPLAILFHLKAPAALGLNVGQVNKIIAEAPNVCVSVYNRDQARPSRQFWLSRRRRLAVEQAGQEWTVMDVAARRRVKGGFSRNLWTESKLSRSDVAGFDQMVRQLLGLSLEGLRLPGGELTPVMGEPDLMRPGVDVYRLVWDVENMGEVLGRKQRLLVSVDSRTGRPIESQIQETIASQHRSAMEGTAADDGWFLVMRKEFAYPEESEIVRRAESLLSTQ